LLTPRRATNILLCPGTSDAKLCAKVEQVFTDILVNNTNVRPFTVTFGWQMDKTGYPESIDYIFPAIRLNQRRSPGICKRLTVSSSAVKIQSVDFQ
jgi:hypothetical protein